jgi:hypothetical protein
VTRSRQGMFAPFRFWSRAGPTPAQLVTGPAALRVSLPGNAGNEPCTTDHRSRRTPLNFFAAAGFFTAITLPEVFLRLVRQRRGNDHEPRVFLAGQQHRRAMRRFQFPVNEDHSALGEAAETSQWLI